MFKNEIKFITKRFSPNIILSIYKQNFHPFSQNSKQFMDRHTKDQFVKKAKLYEYRSRAAFKIIEINNKYKLLRPGHKVLDVGSAPGGWSQIIAEQIKSNKTNPSIIAVDILHMDSLPGVKFVQGDMNSQKVRDKLIEANSYEKFDLICSDMCPEFTGSKLTDHYNLINLNHLTKDFAFKVLKRNGNFVMKTFEGSMQKKFQTEITKFFNKIYRFKPASSRQESSELYLICLGYLENEELKKEAEELMKQEPSEFLEKRKQEALKEYKLRKFDEDFDLRELDKMREDIKTKFKIDPETIRIDEKEEQEIRNYLESLNDEFHKEYHGRAYNPNCKNILDMCDQYQKDMKEYEQKFKEAMKEKKVDIKEFEEFFKVDEDEKYMNEMTESMRREVEFTHKRLDLIDDEVAEEDAMEFMNEETFNENKLLSKYEKWAQLIKERKLDFELEYQDELEEYNQELKEGLSKREGYEDDEVQNTMKKVKKEDKKRSNADTDIFWNKRNSKVNSDLTDEGEEHEEYNNNK